MVNEKITFPYDLIGRDALGFVKQTDDCFRQPVYLTKDERRVNAKSLLGVLSLGVRAGEEIQLTTQTSQDMEILLNIIKKEEF